MNSIELKFIQTITTILFLPFCLYCFVQDHLSVPFCQLPFCPVTLHPSSSPLGLFFILIDQLLSLFHRCSSWSARI